MLQNVEAVDAVASGSLLTLSTRVHQRVEGRCVGGDSVAAHLIEQVQGQLPAPSPVTCQDQAAVGDHIPVQALLHLHVHSCFQTTPRRSYFKKLQDMANYVKDCLKYTMV